MLARHVLKQGLLLRNANAVTRRSYHGGNHKPSTMNDLPIPAGDWKEQFTRQNAKYNAVLALGVLAFVGTIGLVKSTGIIHLNYYPPENLD